MRTAERCEGLAIAGVGSVGGASWRLPALLEAPAAEGRRPGPTVRALPSGAGTRRLVLGDGVGEIELELPVLAPEIVPPTGGIAPVAAGVALLHPPFSSEALGELRATRPELLVLGNARALWSDGSSLVEAIRAVREEVGPEPLLWGPRVALPHRLPLLVYLGFDLLDTTEGELRAAAGEFLDPTLGPRPVGSGTPTGCDCEGCLGASGPSLATHARQAYRHANLEVRAALERGALRELVEARLAAEPAAAETLRYLDRELGAAVEARTPVTDGGSRSYVLAESLRRPEMRRFRDRLLERYRPPPSKSVLLLVPCSRTKPYRKSPSHRRFAGAWEGLPGAHRVHVVSVSSPIGVVPRELEDLPPARSYDIPVTGDWSAEERELVLRGVRHLLSSGRYRSVIAHLDPAEYGFLLSELPQGSPGATVVDGRPTSGASLARLAEALASALAESPPPAAGPLGVVTEELHELAAVQFGRAAADRLFAPPVRLAGRPWFQRVTDGRGDLATVREERGLFHLTVLGAQRLGDAVARVDVDPALSLEGDLFAPGVRGADRSIRTGDSVGLFRDGRLAAVGEAALPGPLLGEVRRGLAVRVRHRLHAPPDTAKTGDLPSETGR